MITCTAALLALLTRTPAFAQAPATLTRDSRVVLTNDVEDLVRDPTRVEDGPMPPVDTIRSISLGQGCLLDPEFGRSQVKRLLPGVTLVDTPMRADIFLVCVVGSIDFQSGAELSFQAQVAAYMPLPGTRFRRVFTWRHKHDSAVPIPASPSGTRATKSEEFLRWHQAGLLAFLQAFPSPPNKK